MALDSNGVRGMRLYRNRKSEFLDFISKVENYKQSCCLILIFGFLTVSSSRILTNDFKNPFSLFPTPPMAAYLQEDGASNSRLTLFGCCSQRGYGHLRADKERT